MCWIQSSACSKSSHPSSSIRQGLDSLFRAFKMTCQEKACSPRQPLKMAIWRSNLISNPMQIPLRNCASACETFLSKLKQSYEENHVRFVELLKILSSCHIFFASHDCKGLFWHRIYHPSFVTPLICFLEMNDTPTPTIATPLTTNHAPMQNNGAMQIDGVEDPPLFSPSLISPEVSSSLPDGYTMRPLRRSDYHGGMACCSRYHHFQLTGPSYSLPPNAPGANYSWRAHSRRIQCTIRLPGLPQ